MDFFAIWIFCIFCPGRDLKPYTGNSILDVVDPVDELYSILCMRNSDYFFSFNFCIGFSKSNFKKLMKKL